MMSSGQLISRAPPTPVTKAWHVELLPQSSVTVSMTGTEVCPINSLQSNSVCESSNVTAPPQLSKLPLSISSGVIVTTVSSPKSILKLLQRADGGVSSLTVIV